jgi:hypothetical protein
MYACGSGRPIGIAPVAHCISTPPLLFGETRQSKQDTVSILSPRQSPKHRLPSWCRALSAPKVSGNSTSMPTLILTVRNSSTSPDRARRSPRLRRRAPQLPLSSSHPLRAKPIQPSRQPHRLHLRLREMALKEHCQRRCKKTRKGSVQNRP